jgi:hypothetical protein
VPAVASIAIGATVWVMFELVISRFGLVGGFSYWWAGYAIMFFASGILGYLFSVRPWRWGIYIVAAHIVVASLRSKGDHSMLPLELIFFVVLAMLYVSASYVGAWISRSKRGRRDRG